MNDKEKKIIKEKKEDAEIITPDFRTPFVVTYKLNLG